MKALFDIGNSRIKWALFDPDGDRNELHNVGGVGHRQPAFDEIASTNWSDWPQPEQVIVSSVAADEHWRQLQDWCIQHWRQTPVRVISTAEGYGIRNAYARPEELGSDRWAAMISAHHLLQRETCVIDCGTAITVDFLDAAGQHLGGYIIPGLRLMQRSLAQRTDAIQLLSGATGELKQSTEPGKSTVECIEHGLLMATTGLVEGGCKQMEMQMGKPFHCLLTGGNAEQLASCLGEEIQVEPHLVLLGLARIAAENHSSGSTN